MLVYKSDKLFDDGISTVLNNIDPFDSQSTGEIVTYNRQYYNTTFDIDHLTVRNINLLHRLKFTHIETLADLGEVIQERFAQENLKCLVIYGLLDTLEVTGQQLNWLLYLMTKMSHCGIKVMIYEQHQHNEEIYNLHDSDKIPIQFILNKWIN